MVDRQTVGANRIYTESGLVACLGLALYNPHLGIGGTAHIRPPYLPVLNYLLSRIPQEFTEGSIVVVAGVSFPLDGNPYINEQSFRCQTLARYTIRQLLVQGGFNPSRIINEFSPPNTSTSLTLNPKTGIVDIHRVNPFKPSEEYGYIRLV